MSDLPTRSKALIRGHGLAGDDWVAGPVLRMYGNGDLLTREEAANDPEVREEAAQTGWVQRRVLQLLLDQLAQDKKQWDESQLFEVTDDE